MSQVQWILLGLMALLFGWMLLKRQGDISAEDARRWIDSGGLLLDVRTAAEFSAGHLPNAINVPVAELGRSSSKLGERDRPIVVYCRSGARSAAAKTLLQRAGFKKVANLGAMSRW